MSNIEPLARAIPVIRSVVVPSQLYFAASRSNLSLMDLLVFGKISKIASPEDIAVFAAMNDSSFINGTRIATHSLKDSMSLGDGNQIQFRAVFDVLAKSAEITNLVKASLTPLASPFKDMLSLPASQGIAKPVEDTSIGNTLGANLTSAEDSVYQLKTSGSNVFVVAGNGFDKYIGTGCVKECADSFVKHFMKHASELYGSAEVARHPLFKTFLHSLAE